MTLKIFILLIAFTWVSSDERQDVQLDRAKPVLTRAVEGQLDAQAIQALLREMEAKHNEAYAKLEHYSYLLKRTEHQLNDKGEETKSKVHEYRVFPRGQGLTVSAMLSENGKQLSPEKLRKEKARANKEWLKYKKNPRDRDQRSKVGAQKPTPPWFEGLDFTRLPPERLEEREVMVLSFRPRSDYSPKENADKFISGLKGRIWIDPIEKMVLKTQAELTRDFSAGGLSGWLSSLKPGTALTIENMRLANGLWVVKRVDFSSIVKERGFLMLPHTSRFRLVDEMSDYRPFDPEAVDLFLP